MGLLCLFSVWVLHSSTCLEIITAHAIGALRYFLTYGRLLICQVYAIQLKGSENCIKLISVLTAQLYQQMKNEQWSKNIINSATKRHLVLPPGSFSLKFRQHDLHTVTRTRFVFLPHGVLVIYARCFNILLWEIGWALTFHLPPQCHNLLLLCHYIQLGKSFTTATIASKYLELDPGSFARDDLNGLIIYSLN